MKNKPNFIKLCHNHKAKIIQKLTKCLDDIVIDVNWALNETGDNRILFCDATLENRGIIIFATERS